MGGCFGKHKKNRVSPDPNGDDEHNDISSRLSRATPFNCPLKQQQEDMMKQLKAGQAPFVSKGGISFTIDYRPATPNAMPRRLAAGEKVATNKTKDDNVYYTTEEREIMAGLLRDDILEERRQKARLKLIDFGSSVRSSINAC